MCQCQWACAAVPLLVGMCEEGGVRGGVKDCFEMLRNGNSFGTVLMSF